jgi:ABC-type Fe3+/spermidine/putrescine transport system ATPase subunit
VAIRPEKIQLATGPLAAVENGFPAVVEEIAYLGTDTQYSVRISGALTFSVRQQNSTVSQALRVGDQVCACFSADAVRILEA